MEDGFNAAARQQEKKLEELVHSQTEEDLRGVASHPALTEDVARSLLTKRGLPSSVLQELSRNSSVMKLRSIVMGVASHPETPRHVSIPLIRSLYTFELMQLALQPAVPADIKMIAEDTLISRLGQVATGERITLAKRGSTRIAAALLTDPDDRIYSAALNNPYVTEVQVAKALRHSEVPAGLVTAVCRHHKWSVRRDVRIALLRNPNTPAPTAVEIAHTLPADIAEEAVGTSNLPESTKSDLLAHIQRWPMDS